jgi:hypothetical protein
LHIPIASHREEQNAPAQTKSPPEKLLFNGKKQFILPADNKRKERPESSRFAGNHRFQRDCSTKHSVKHNASLTNQKAAEAAAWPSMMLKASSPNTFAMTLLSLSGDVLTPRPDALTLLSPNAVKLPDVPSAVTGDAVARVDAF